MAGQNATLKAGEMLSNAGCVVRVAIIPDGKDPDESLGHLRLRGETPIGEVALGQESQVVELPLRKTGRLEDAAVGIAASQPQIVGGSLGQLDREEGRQLDDRQPAGERLRHVPHERR